VDEGIFFSLRLSVQVASFATVLVVVIGIPCAYLIARRDFRGREALDMAFTLPLVLPPSVIGYYLIVLFGRNGVVGSHLFAWTGWTIMFTWQAAVVASFVVALPLMVKSARTWLTARCSSRAVTPSWRMRSMASVKARSIRS